MITPTVGRVCLYLESPEETWPKIEGLPFAAFVCGVLPSGNVNLSVFDAEGSPHPKLNVAFSEDPQAGCAHWMQYQKGQAQKAEALEQKLAESQPSRTTHILGQPVTDELTGADDGSPAETQTAGEDPPALAGSAAAEQSGTAAG